MLLLLSLLACTCNQPTVANEPTPEVRFDDESLGDVPAVECPYTLHLSDTAPYDPICSGDLEKTSELQPGDLFTAEMTPNTFYYSGDGRHSVPHGSVFESWWGSDTCACEQVKLVPDEVALEIVIMSNLTIKPGAFIVKISSDPSLYVIESACTFRKANEDVLAEIYGAEWQERVRTLADTFFVDYEIGPDVTSAADYNLSAGYATTIESVIAGCDR